LALALAFLRAQRLRVVFRGVRVFKYMVGEGLEDRAWSRKSLLPPKAPKAVET
jgi:hypothetical protein